MEPLIVPANQPSNRFYLGGRRIADFRGSGVADPYTPEDWVGSITSVHGQAPLGMTRLPDGRWLADAIASDPRGWLGEKHLAAYGIDTGLLVKLLDAGQRLPVHAHPSDSFARKHLGTAHGKAEAWYILSPGSVYLGLMEPIDHQRLRALVEDQSVEEMLGLMHRVDVAPHDTVYVPAGLLHSVGEGVFLAEVQQPEDLSILLEWRDFELDGTIDGHLGLGFHVALEAVEVNAHSVQAISDLILRNASCGEVLVEPATEFFRLHRTDHGCPLSIEAGFAVVICIEGRARIRSGEGRMLALPAGSTALIPHDFGSYEVAGDAKVLVARPPATPAL